MTALDDAEVAIPLRRNRDFLLLWTGNWLQFFGSRMSAASYPLLALAVSGGSARAAGFAATAAVLPYLILQLPAGVFVDRWDRRLTMTVCAAGRVLVLGVAATAVAAGLMTAPVLLTVIAADMSFTIVAGLAERAAIRMIVPVGQLRSALSFNEARGRIAGLLGGPAGVVLYAWSRWWPFVTAAAGAAFAAAASALIRTKTAPDRGESQRHLGRDLAEGLRWVRRHPVLRPGIILVGLSTVLLQVVSLALVVILVQEQGRDESTVALLLGISGCGGVLGALSARWWMSHVPFPALLIGGFLAWAVLMGLMAVATGPVVLGALFGAMNLIGAIFGVAIAVYQMAATAATMQGRVTAIAGLVTAAGSTAGASASGFLLDRWGGSVTLTVAAVGMAAVALAAAAVPAMRHARLGAGRTTRDAG